MGLKRQKAGGGSRPGDDNILLLHHIFDDVADPGDWLLHMPSLHAGVTHLLYVTAPMICL